MTTLNRRHLFAISRAGLAYASVAPAALALDQSSPSEMPSGATSPTDDLRYVDLPGARLAYSRHGPGGRPPLVFGLLRYFPDFAANEPLADELVGMVEYAVEYGYFTADRDLEWSRRLNPATLTWEQFLVTTGWRGETRAFGG